jgi:hypothetical protein
MCPASMSGDNPCCGHPRELVTAKGKATPFVLSDNSWSPEPQQSQFGGSEVARTASNHERILGTVGEDSETLNLRVSIAEV